MSIIDFKMPKIKFKNMKMNVEEELNNIDYEKIINHLKKQPLSDYYKKIHLANIIGHEKREELEWNMLKTLK